MTLSHSSKVDVANTFEKNSVLAFTPSTNKDNISHPSNNTALHISRSDLGSSKMRHAIHHDSPSTTDRPTTLQTPLQSVAPHTETSDPTQQWNEADLGNDDQAAYGAHQSYGTDGNYNDPYYAMSAATQYDREHNDSEYEDSETYAS